MKKEIEAAVLTLVKGFSGMVDSGKAAEHALAIERLTKSLVNIASFDVVTRGSKPVRIKGADDA